MEAALGMFGSQEEAMNHLLRQPNQNTANLPVPSAGTQSTTAADLVSSGGGPSSQIDGSSERDVEMEEELTEELQNADAYSDYDIEVTKEGEAITQYLALLDSAENN